MQRGVSCIANTGFVLVLAACASCKSNGGSATQPGSPTSAAGANGTAGDDSNVDAGADAGDALTAYCPDGSIDSNSLAAGVSAKGQMVTAKFVQATPDPPARYDNNWVFDFTDETGAPIADLMMTKVDTWMPYHGHGWPGHGTAMSQPGRFNVDINLNMRGYFRVDLDVSSATKGADHIEFFYCFR